MYAQTYHTAMPARFQVTGALFNEHTNEEAPDDLQITLTFHAEEAQWRFDLGDGHEWSISTHEVEAMYIAHMCAQIEECGVTVSDDTFFAYKGIHVFHFGAYGETHVLAFGSLDDALESAADVAPKGIFTELDLEDARRTLIDSGELTEADAAENGDEASDMVYEEATTDLTYTESGYIASWEWTATTFDSLEAALTFAQSL